MNINRYYCCYKFAQILNSQSMLTAIMTAIATAERIKFLAPDLVEVAGVVEGGVIPAYP